ncbi:MAG TPA: hypothetical protein VGP47_03730 [Parachlamydiaceae bacterium]|nr:hypothetical protein [Parachlamydiaceae bacterium]
MKLSEGDVALSDRIIGIIRQLSPYSKATNAPQWDPKEILAEARRILNLHSHYQDYYYQMEGAGHAFDDLLTSLEGMFQICSKIEIIQSLQGLTEMVAKDLDDIMNGCDEGMPWQFVGERLGKYWLQLSCREDLVGADRSSILSFISKLIPKFASYGLDQPFYPAMKILERGAT